MLGRDRQERAQPLPLPLDGLELGDLTSLTREWEEIKVLLSIPKGTAVDPRTTDDEPAPDPEPETQPDVTR